MWHNTGNYAGIMPTGLTVQPYEHAENPETKRRFKNLLDVAGLTDQLIEILPRPATEQEVLMLHESDYLERIKVLNEAGGDAGVFTPMGVGSYDIALLAVGGVIELVDAVLDGRVDNGYAPGASPRASRIARDGDGLLYLLQRSNCRSSCFRETRARTHRLRRLGCASWQWYRNSILERQSSVDHFDTPR